MFEMVYELLLAQPGRPTGEPLALKLPAPFQVLYGGPEASERIREQRLHLKKKLTTSQQSFPSTPSQE
ncbi:hypothetical protein [Stutzerimonas zhaodongensis]|uniref:hypothetical protein n=1 Tax=Stutzerimonas TaxID=2901164 RepID=UPI00388D2248